MSNGELDRVEHLLGQVTGIIKFGKVVIGILFSIFSLVIGIALWVNHVNAVQAESTAWRQSFEQTYNADKTENNGWRSRQDNTDIRLTTILENQQKQLDILTEMHLHQN